MANVLVYRRHVNNNISGAVYLVDLKCLGVKDTMWFFNEDEETMFKKFGGEDLEFEIIDYEVAHNIVYAGYDFAMEYQIHPHKEFATSRFVLEDDNDSIPLVEIPVGEGPENKPHLMEHTPGQYAHALAKLKKLAGKDNYYYTTSLSTIDEESDDFLDEDNEDEIADIRLADIAADMLDFDTVKNVISEDLENRELLQNRNEFEQIICMAELLMRIHFEIPSNEYTPPDADMMEDAGWETRNAYLNNYAEGIDEQTYNEGIGLFEAYSMKMGDGNLSEEQKQILLENVLSTKANNPFFLVLLLESKILYPEKAALVLPYLQKHRHLCLVMLVLAFYNLVNHIHDADTQIIIESLTIRNGLPHKSGYDENELCIYYAIQTLRHALAQNLPAAIANYDQLTETIDTGIHIFLLTVMYDSFLPALASVLDEEPNNKANE